MRHLFMGGNGCFGNAGFATATTTTKIKTTNAIDFAKDSRFYSKGATDNITMNACAVQSALTTCLYLISLSTAGAVTVTKGKEVATDALANGDVSLNFPDNPDGLVVIGAMRVATAAATTFTCGTTALDASGVTASFLNLVDIPADNLTA